MARDYDGYISVRNASEFGGHKTRYSTTDKPAPVIVQLFDKAGKSFAVTETGSIYEFTLFARHGQLYIELLHYVGKSKFAISKSVLDDLYNETI